jgi:large subunit ribosomal protein L25
MQVYELNGELRSDFGKKANKALRKVELVPCELYGGGENIHFSVTEKAIMKSICTPNVYIFKLNISGKQVDAVIREIQFHPVSDRILHADFFLVQDGKPVTVEIPVRLDGFAKGVQAGGKLSIIIRKLKVKALAKDLPDVLPVEVTELGLGNSVKVSSLSYPGVEILNAKSAVVAQVKLTRAARAAMNA